MFANVKLQYFSLSCNRGERIFEVFIAFVATESLKMCGGGGGTGVCREGSLAGQEAGEEVPDGYTARYGDVERVLGAALGYLETYVTLVDDLLVDSIDLVAEDEGIAASALGREVLKLDAAFHLLEAAEGVTVVLERGDTLGRSGIVDPLHRLLGAEGCLVYLGRRGAGADAAEGYPLDGKSVAGAENGSDIVEAPDIVEHDGEVHLFLAAIVVEVYAV